jgi:spermidine dehydrogenase
MRYKITRREFINGVAVTTGATLIGPNGTLFGAGRATSDYYPPSLTGMRGNHPGSFETSHAFAWNGVKPSEFESLDEHYDLVIVGAGISGLAAAHFFQQRFGQDAKILLLDNHDDFGGHAKRNEFNESGRMLLAPGGSLNIEQPDHYSDVAKDLLADLDIDLTVMQKNMDEYGLMSAQVETLLSLPGANGHVSVRGTWPGLMFGIGDFESAVRALPLPESEKDKLTEFIRGEIDYLKDLSASEKQTYVETTSYREYLLNRVGFAEDTIAIFFQVPLLMYGTAGWRSSVMEAFYLGCPGIQGMRWLGELADQIVAGLTAPGQSSAYFPDGNASLTRLLVHKLIPKVAPGAGGFSDIAAQRFDYGALDRADHPVHLRLNSTAVGVQENKDKRVAVNYVQNGRSVSVTGDRCILACYNGAIPYLCPDLPEKQKEGLRYGVKVPLTVTNVLLKDGRAWSKMGAGAVNCPQDPYVSMTTPPPTTTGGYQLPQNSDDPMLVYLLGVPNVEITGKETSREILRTARHKVYATTFETYEQEVRDQLQGVLGEFGFNHETDIRAITVNRWPHGYAYEYMSLDDKQWPEGKAPHEIGRAQFGRISIANSDSEAYAYVNAAIDSAWRAVEEQTG